MTSAATASGGEGGRRTGPQSRAWRQLFRKQFRKTKLCRFYPLGECRFGQDCPYAHDPKEIESAPDLTKTALCVDFANGCCYKSGDECPFAHGQEELRTTDAFAGSPLCKRVGANHLGEGGELQTATNDAAMASPIASALAGGCGAAALHQMSPPQQAAGKSAARKGRSRKNANGGGGSPSQSLGNSPPTGAPAVMTLSEAVVPGPQPHGLLNRQAPVGPPQQFPLPPPAWANPVVGNGHHSVGLSPPAAAPSPAPAVAPAPSGYPQDAPPNGPPRLATAVDPGLLSYMGVAPQTPPTMNPTSKPDAEVTPSKQDSKGLRLVDSSPGSTATPASRTLNLSPIITERDYFSNFGGSRDLVVTRADPAYVSVTEADYRSVSPDGRASPGRRMGSSPSRMMWPRTPSSCDSPGRASPGQQWPQTPTSTAAGSPNASPSPPRKARGDLNTAQLNRRLRDIFEFPVVEENKGETPSLGVQNTWPGGGGQPVQGDISEGRRRSPQKRQQRVQQNDQEQDFLLQRQQQMLQQNQQPPAQFHQRMQGPGDIGAERAIADHLQRFSQPVLQPPPLPQHEHQAQRHAPQAMAPQQQPLRFSLNLESQLMRSPPDVFNAGYTTQVTSV